MNEKILRIRQIIGNGEKVQSSTYKSIERAAEVLSRLQGVPFTPRQCKAGIKNAIETGEPFPHKETRHCYTWDYLLEPK